MRWHCCQFTELPPAAGAQEEAGRAEAPVAVAQAREQHLEAPVQPQAEEAMAQWRRARRRLVARGLAPGQPLEQRPAETTFGTTALPQLLAMGRVRMRHPVREVIAAASRQCVVYLKSRGNSI